MTFKIAALYVDSTGPYPALVGPENCWDEARDARKYAGPLPVVAHPPCGAWGRYATGERIGDDGGCFQAAYRAICAFDGVLEHPAYSRAWGRLGLVRPPVAGGWVRDPQGEEWTCHVEQGHYGHRARKATWLLYVGPEPPPLVWGPSVASIRPRPGRDPIRERRIGAVQRMCHRERRLTPPAFAEVLCRLAEGSAR